MLDWPLCRNARDLGGIPLADGGAIRIGALVRSDNLDQLDDRGIAAVRAAGVSRIVDLRSEWECETFPSPFAHDALWLNAPLTDPADPDVSTLALVQQYRMLLDEHAHRFATAIAGIAEAPPGCVVVTCHAGKDRTGLVTALALDLVGASSDAIAADYAQFGDSHIHRTTTIGDRPNVPLPELSLPRAETMIHILEHLRHQYGGAAAYLVHGGATADHLTSLKTRLSAA
ncbi:tyrosine-protein phosphatase [Kribbella hippodromi]|uniref:Tyrosine-protein phosphatase n=2 Tax=Kribbella hippodromi TaxID=434347 RepID=A0ABP4NRQ0_9ACTN